MGMVTLGKEIVDTWRQGRGPAFFPEDFEALASLIDAVLKEESASFEADRTIKVANALAKGFSDGILAVARLTKAPS